MLVNKIFIMIFMNIILTKNKGGLSSAADQSTGHSVCHRRASFAASVAKDTYSWTEVDDCRWTYAVSIRRSVSSRSPAAGTCLPRRFIIESPFHVQRAVSGDRTSPESRRPSDLMILIAWVSRSDDIPQSPTLRLDRHFGAFLIPGCDVLGK